MKGFLTFLTVLMFAFTASATPEVTYCFQPTFDPDCSLGDSETTATITEGLYMYIVDVYAKSNTGDPQIDNWCTVKARFNEVLVSGPNPLIGFLQRESGSGESDAGYKATSEDTPNREHLWYLTDDASDDSIVDGTTETRLGTLRIHANFGGYAPCTNSVVQLVPNLTTRPYGISETIVDSEFSCGGVDPSDGVSVTEVLQHEVDASVDQATTLTVTVIPDADHDFVRNSEDNCMYHSNWDQLDTNEDGYGNACDTDYNNDGIVGTPDFILLSAKWACSLTVGRCSADYTLCTLSNPECSGEQTCEVCYDEDYDVNGTGILGTPEFIVMSSLWGQYMTDQNTCED